MIRLLVATTLFAAAAVPAQNGKKGDFKVAIVDLGVVQQKSKWASGLLLDAKQRSNKDRQDLQELRAKLQRKTKDLDLYVKGSEPYDRVQLELGMLRTKHSNLQKMYESWYNRRVANALLAVRAKTDATIAAIAQKNGYLLVLRKTVIPKDTSVSNKLMALQSKIVLYAHKSIDISEQVAQMIDADGVGNASSKGDAKKSEASATKTKKGS